ncbi:MAG: hypothetical protein Q4P78_02380 [Rothia sp. (in: high G+C Gram-positive bacteria)]|uniref:hypothetical protein n=1 Tax=Rothia sp. (in: high G+C Gram-positive bacteria) TaxID=1885016 RepID=UPI0026DF4EA2|nr:hypothetical protein [Rothia sp. (in: high G+C Gram-positive bacteria)]MDO5750034.1 hypothetical protein [Rothia sp. (in: high G+C Gram-positive bacteria)]
MTTLPAQMAPKKPAKPYSKRQTTALATILISIPLTFLIFLLPMITATMAGKTYTFNGYSPEATSGGDLSVLDLSRGSSGMFSITMYVYAYAVLAVLPFIFTALALWLRKGWLRITAAILSLGIPFILITLPRTLGRSIEYFNTRLDSMHTMNNPEWHRVYPDAVHVDASIAPTLLCVVGVVVLVCIVVALIPAKRPVVAQAQVAAPAGQ